jgi:acetyl esterase/lipase
VSDHADYARAALRRERAVRIREASPDITPPNVDASFGLFAGEHQERGYQAPVITRDIAYGSDPRHRLDVHSERGAGHGGAGPVPVLVFVHGGGFVSGDKHLPGTPYYDHIGAWAVGHGMVGVTMTYRLAPRHRWPAAAEDVSQAIAWVSENIHDHGGDPARVVLAGHSAGATHVACYLAGHAGPPSGVAAGALLSGIYDLSGGASDVQTTYFGTDSSAYASRSPLAGLVDCGIPVLLALAELDPPEFHQQAAGALQAFMRCYGRLPQICYAADHNHISEIAALGIDDEPLGLPLLRFIESVTAAPLPRPEHPAPAPAAIPAS